MKYQHNIVGHARYNYPYDAFTDAHNLARIMADPWGHDYSPTWRVRYMLDYVRSFTRYALPRDQGVAATMRIYRRSGV